MLQIVNLKCEYQINPLGIDARKPRLFWQVRGEGRGVRQMSYQIQAAGREADLLAEINLLWDSGRVESDQTTHVIYGGLSLQSRQRVYWRVRAWDENDQVSNFSAAAWWEMGLLDPGDWCGQWIGHVLVGGPHNGVPSPYFRKSFHIEKPLTSARLYITALGLYDASINGLQIGDAVLTPGWTDYQKRVQYLTYDLTDLLRQGENAIGVVLGDGWYSGFIANRTRQIYGDRPKLLAQIVLDYADGSQDVIVTDSSWRVATGALVAADMLHGESYDARLEISDWNAPGFDDSGWLSAQIFNVSSIALDAKLAPPVRRIMELAPVSEPRPIAVSPRQNKWIFDMGQNMVGWVRLNVSGAVGTTIRLRYAEVLNADGTIYTENLRAAKATDYYTMKGQGEEIYEPRFTFHGFRYVEVDGFPGKPTTETITGIVVASDTPPTGEFTCSDPLINQLQQNIIWGQRGNFLDVPTDCPQRDERLGWTGDAQVFIRTAAFNMDVAAFFSKWQVDLADAQGEGGNIPPVVPNIQPYGLPDDGGPGWADAVIICPWTVYLCYGDKTLLQTHYDSMKRFVNHMEAESINLIRMHPDAGEWQGFGDWLSINAETPKDLIGTAFFAYDARLLSEIAHVVGSESEASHYADLAARVREAFFRRFVTADGLITGLSQTAYVLALHFDLLPDELRPAAAHELVRDIEKRAMHLSTGFVGAPYLPFALTKMGRLDMAYKLLSQKSWPSWLYPVTQGATTIWERWDGWTHDKGFQDAGMNSFNHYAYGSIGAWLYSVVTGIDIDPVQPGYKHIILRPRLGVGLSSARAALETLHGRVVSDWKLNGDELEWHIEIPTNTTATIYFPAGEGVSISERNVSVDEFPDLDYVGREDGAAVYNAVSGSYHFVLRG